MNVAELMAKLHLMLARGEVYPETRVIADGCDCWEDAQSLEVANLPSKGSHPVMEPCLVVSREPAKPCPTSEPDPVDPETRTFTTTKGAA